MTIPVVTAWILMLVSGAAGHQLHQPHLFIGYWPMLLICIILSITGWLLRGGRK